MTLNQGSKNKGVIVMGYEKETKDIIDGYCLNPRPSCGGFETYPTCGKTDRPCYKTMQLMERAMKNQAFDDEQAKNGWAKGWTRSWD